MNNILKMGVSIAALSLVIGVSVPKAVEADTQLLAQSKIGTLAASDVGGGSNTGIGSGSPGSNVGAGAGGNNSSGARTTGANDLSNPKEVPLGGNGQLPRPKSQDAKDSKQ